MSVIIRLATTNDAAAIVDIYAPYVQGTSISFEYEVPTVEDYQKRIEHTLEFFPFYVLEEDGVPAGYAYASFFHARKAYQWLCETTIYVHQDHHHKGFASMLYDKLLQTLRAQGFCEAIAILGCPNVPSEKFHEALGFKLIGTFENAGYKLDEWHDVKWYGLELAPRQHPPRDPVPYCELNLSYRKKMEKGSIASIEAMRSAHTILA